jgi:hypothetical protein
VAFPSSGHSTGRISLQKNCTAHCIRGGACCGAKVARRLYSAGPSISLTIHKLKKWQSASSIPAGIQIHIRETMVASITKWLSKQFKGASFSKKRPTTANAKADEKNTTVASSDGSVSDQEKSESVMIVEKWITAWKYHKIDEVVSMSAPDCQYLVTMDDGETMPVDLKDFIDQMLLCYASFPDYDTTWESIEEDPSNGAIVIKNFTSKGTHTGEPYAFGPFPPISASGAVIKDDPVSLHIFLKDGRPHRIRTVSEGGQIGPASYYTQIGGVLI